MDPQVPSAEAAKPLKQRTAHHKIGIPDFVLVVHGGHFVFDSQAIRMQIAFTFSTLFRLRSVRVTVTLTMKPELIA